jgi:hypothetical protein
MVASDSLGLGRAHPVRDHKKRKDIKKNKALCMMVSISSYVG